MNIKIVRQILEWNEDCHKEIQEKLHSKNIFMINVMGSPGCGKTTFILDLIEEFKNEFNIGVIEGDITGKIDAEKIACSGIPVVQLNTEGACHLEAMSIKNVLDEFDLDKMDILFIENIGNLVCPAEFDIGENLKIALLSVPEGDDKVIKYPLMFRRSDALIINKYDMKDYFDFQDSRVYRSALEKNDKLKIFNVNSKSGAGIEGVSRWIRNLIQLRVEI